MTDVPQYVPQEVCLACQGCCRFTRKDSEWQPQVTAVDRDRPGGLKASDVDFKGRVKTESCGKKFKCRFINEKNNHCGIYPARPLDCRLYPFLVVAGKEVCVHLACPFVQETYDTQGFEEYVAELKKFLTKDAGVETRNALKELKHDYQDNRDELVHLFDL